MAEPNDMADDVLNAMRNHLAKENGYLTGFSGIVTYIDGDGGRCWAMINDESQSIPLTLGLAQMLTMAVQGQAASQLFSVPEE